MDPLYHVDIISGFLTGPADTWFHRWFESQKSPSAERLLSDLVTHFCPANVSQEARRKLAALKQRTSVSEYSIKFRELMEEIDHISENEAKTYYINGLKDAVKKEVLLKDLYDELSLDKVEQISVQIDNIVFQNKGMNRSVNFGRPHAASNGPTPMEGIQFGRLSPEEQAKFRQENRCFNCKRQGQHASGCRSKYVFKNNLDVGESLEDSNKEANEDSSC